MRKITTALFLFSTVGAFGQNVTREDLNKELKPLSENMKTLHSENSKLKIDIGNLNTPIER